MPLPFQLQQNEQLLDYLLSYRELMSWAAEFQARMTSPELSENLQEATAVHSRHQQLNDEMKIRLETDFAVLVSVPLVSNAYSTQCLSFSIGPCRNLS